MVLAVVCLSRVKMLICASMSRPKSSGERGLESIEPGAGQESREPGDVACGLDAPLGGSIRPFGAAPSAHMPTGALSDRRSATRVPTCRRADKPEAGAPRFMAHLRGVGLTMPRSRARERWGCLVCGGSRSEVVAPIMSACRR